MRHLALIGFLAVASCAGDVATAVRAEHAATDQQTADTAVLKSRCQAGAQDACLALSAPDAPVGTP